MFCNMKAVIFSLRNPLLQSITVQIDRGIFGKVQKVNRASVYIKRCAMLEQFV